jgi:signal transduction histidine kinase
MALTTDSLPSPLRFSPTVLQSVYTLTSRIGSLLDRDALFRELCRALLEITRLERALILLADEDGQLRVVAGEGRPGTPVTSNGTVTLFNRAPGPLVEAWNSGLVLRATADDCAAEGILGEVAQSIAMREAFTISLRGGDKLLAVVLLDNPQTGASLLDVTAEHLTALAPIAASAVQNALLHTRTTRELANKNFELSILNQIDRELTETIILNHVFSMTLDWAMRYTNGTAAILTTYNEATDELRFAGQIGYEMTAEQYATITSADNRGIAQRVARTGHADNIPDVTTDHNYIAFSNRVRSHLSVPVKREERVIAVISVESRKLNAFSDDHMQFVQKLAVRAGVAIDNARLFADSQRERGKLAHVLTSIADAVIVIDADDRVILINPMSIAALRLYPEQNYVGQLFETLVEDSPIVSLLKNVRKFNQQVVEEQQLPNGRTYHINIAPLEGVGWMIVMHDITPYKETDQLKSDLLNTVSHDLKQPLGIMEGYVELLIFRNNFDEVSTGYIARIQRSFKAMRQLIDDLLDYAQIESSGLRLELLPVAIREVIQSCAEDMRQPLSSKSMQLSIEVNPMPRVKGDPRRLQQIFTNLISNAIKYTPPEGRIRISAEELDDNIRISVQDTGLGISPEDQARIFERFYRVRRAETENIEGTGMGLAIVKRLVEAHNGQLGIESRLGEGTTIHVTLPVQR